MAKGIKRSVFTNVLAAVLLLALCMPQFAAAEGSYGADTDSFYVSGGSGWGSDAPSDMTAAPQMNTVFHFSDNGQMDFIGETSAQFGYIRITSNINVHDVTAGGCELTDADGTVLADHSEPAYFLNDSTIIHYFRINADPNASDICLSLIPGTDYRFRVFVIYNGQKYCSDWRNFRTLDASAVITPVPVEQNAEFYFLDDGQMDSMGETSAQFGYIRITSNINVHDVTASGCELADADGRILAEHAEPAYFLNDSTIIHYFRINADPDASDICMLLTPGIDYRFRVFVIYNGQKYYSEWQNFRTDGTAFQPTPGVDVPAEPTRTPEPVLTETPAVTNEPVPAAADFISPVVTSAPDEMVPVFPEAPMITVKPEHDAAHTVEPELTAAPVVTETPASPVETGILQTKTTETPVAHDTPMPTAVPVSAFVPSQEASFSFSDDESMDSISGNAAQFGYIRITANWNIEDSKVRAGCELADASGNILAAHEETAYITDGAMTLYFRINGNPDESDICYTLTPGTRYKFRSYVSFNGEKYYSSWRDFSTTEAEVYDVEEEAQQSEYEEALSPQETGASSTDADAGENSTGVYPCTAATIRDKVSVRMTTDQKSRRVTQIAKVGTDVTVLDETYDDSGAIWYFIRVSDGSEGFVRGDVLELNSDVPIAGDSEAPGTMDTQISWKDAYRQFITDKSFESAALSLSPDAADIYDHTEETNYFFSLSDLNDDNVPECIVLAEYGVTQAACIYTIKNGEVIQLGSMGGDNFFQHIFYFEDIRLPGLFAAIGGPAFSLERCTYDGTAFQSQYIGEAIVSDDGDDITGIRLNENDMDLQQALMDSDYGANSPSVILNFYRVEDFLYLL